MCFATTTPRTYASNEYILKEEELPTSSHIFCSSVFSRFTAGNGWNNDAAIINHQFTVFFWKKVNVSKNIYVFQCLKTEIHASFLNSSMYTYFFSFFCSSKFRSNEEKKRQKFSVEEPLHFIHVPCFKQTSKAALRIEVEYSATFFKVYIYSFISYIKIVTLLLLIDIQKFFLLFKKKAAHAIQQIGKKLRSKRKKVFLSSSFFSSSFLQLTYVFQFKRKKGVQCKFNWNTLLLVGDSSMRWQ